MKKSQRITLTVVAAMGMAARAQQTPKAPAEQQPPPQTCEERRNVARAAGIRFTEVCGHRSTAHSTSRGGFGATGKGHSGGG
jgi:hypothetical protein